MIFVIAHYYLILEEKHGNFLFACHKIKIIVTFCYHQRAYFFIGWIKHSFSQGKMSLFERNTILSHLLGTLKVFLIFMWRNYIPKLGITFPSKVLVSSDKRPYRKMTFHNRDLKHAHRPFRNSTGNWGEFHLALNETLMFSSNSLNNLSFGLLWRTQPAKIHRLNFTAVFKILHSSFRFHIIRRCVFHLSLRFFFFNSTFLFDIPAVHF